MLVSKTSNKPLPANAADYSLARIASAFLSIVAVVMALVVLGVEVFATPLAGLLSDEECDALMDLADMLHIPPRAISLNGTLGIAFGSRGSGWPLAAGGRPTGCGSPQRRRVCGSGYAALARCGTR